MKSHIGIFGLSLFVLVAVSSIARAVYTTMRTGYWSCFIILVLSTIACIGWLHWDRYRNAR